MQSCLKSQPTAQLMQPPTPALQDPRLFGLTVAGNIAYGAPSASRAEVEAAARLANAHVFIAALPQGYDTPVTDKLLSGGQRQRIAIAR